MPKNWKPGASHPWKLRTRLSVADAEQRKLLEQRKLRRRNEAPIDVFDDLRAEEESHDRLEAAELERSIKVFE